MQNYGRSTARNGNEMADTMSRTTRLFDRLRTLWRIQRYALPFWHNILLRLVAGPTVRLLPLVVAFIGRYAVNEVFPQKNVSMWIACAIGVLVAWLFTFCFELAHHAMMYEMTTRQEMCLRDRLFRHVLNLSLRFHEKRPIGENVFRLIAGDVSPFNPNITILGQDAIDTVGLCSIGPVELVGQAIQAAIVLNVLAMFPPKITVMVVGYVAVHVMVNHAVMSYVQRANRESRAARQRVEARARESLTLFKVTKAFGRQIFENCRFFRTAADAMRRNMRYEVGNILFTTTSLHFTPLFVLVLDYVAGMEIFAGRMQPGDFVVFPSLVVSLLTPVSMGYLTLQQFRLRFVALDRVRETLETQPDIVEAAGARPLLRARGEIEFRNVSFGYDPGKPVLHKLNFRIPAGEKVAFVGPSGAGKTSVVNLMMRFYDPTSGTVLIDGHDVRHIRQRDLRAQMGLVLQESFLFSGSIAFNIRYGKPSAESTEVERAARIANIHEFIESLPHKYETVLSESEELSGGQKQRVAIARAVVREPRILVLDEATSAIDPLAEREIVAEINGFAQGRTIVVVAHNLISVRDADRIIVLHNGRIVQEGTHNELMRQEGLYRTLWAEEIARDT